MHNGLYYKNLIEKKKFIELKTILNSGIKKAITKKEQNVDSRTPTNIISFNLNDTLYKTYYIDLTLFASDDIDHFYNPYLTETKLKLKEMKFETFEKDTIISIFNNDTSEVITSRRTLPTSIVYTVDIVCEDKNVKLNNVEKSVLQFSIENKFIGTSYFVNNQKKIFFSDKKKAFQYIDNPFFIKSVEVFYGISLLNKFTLAH